MARLLRAFKNEDSKRVKYEVKIISDSVIVHVNMFLGVIGLFCFSEYLQAR